MRRAVLAVGLSLVVAACGTTVPLTSQQAAGTASGLDGGLGVTTPDGAASAAPGFDGTAVDGGATSPSGGVSSGQSSGSLPGGSTPGATRGPSAVGGSAPVGGPTGGLAPVKIGFTTVPDAAAFFAAFGASAEDVDQAAAIRSAVAWVNTHGGLNGHKLDAKIEEVSATSQDSYDSQYQRLCQKYTQDDKVAAASNVGVGANSNMDACMNRAKTLFLTGSNTLHDEQDYAATPLVVSPHEVSSSVLAKTIAQLIVGRAFEKSGGNVGLLNYDIPEYNRAFDRYLKPILAAAGIGVVRYTIPPPASTADIGNSVSVVQSAQLKMAAQGVKTVTFLCSGCAAFFIQAANSQNYYPRYVLSSLDTPGAADGSTYERALRSSVSIGWQPAADYGTTAPPAPPAYSATYKRCYDIQKKGGVIKSAGSVGIAIVTCEAVLQFYEAARANPTSEITATSLRDGLLKLGTSHPSALNFATDLTPAKHAGAAQYRLMTWNDRCSCPAYSGPSLTFPAP